MSEQSAASARPRLPIGQRRRYDLTGSVWTIAADYDHPPAMVAAVPALRELRCYWVETTDGHQVPMEHTVITSGTTPAPDEDTAVEAER